MAQTPLFLSSLTSYCLDRRLLTIIGFPRVCKEGTELKLTVAGLFFPEDKTAKT